MRREFVYAVSVSSASSVEYNEGKRGIKLIKSLISTLFQTFFCCNTTLAGASVRDHGTKVDGL